jgi:hypothetical protein
MLTVKLSQTSFSITTCVNFYLDIVIVFIDDSIYYDGTTKYSIFDYLCSELKYQFLFPLNSLLRIETDRVNEIQYPRN